MLDIGKWMGAGGCLPGAIKGYIPVGIDYMTLNFVTQPWIHLHANDKNGFSVVR
jgi:hypothetical protein